jgi:hypothetical protein
MMKRRGKDVNRIQNLTSTGAVSLMKLRAVYLSFGLT